MSVRIGDVAGDPNGGLYDIRAIDVAEDGSIYILEGDRGVSVYDPTGRWIRRFGPKGHGPEELWNARSIAVGPDTVFVLDDALKLFSTSGTYLGQTTSEDRTFARSHKIAYTRRGLAVFRYGVRGFRGSVFSDTLELTVVDVRTGALIPPVEKLGFTSYRLLEGASIEGPPLLGVPPRMEIGADGRIVRTGSEVFRIEITAPTGHRTRTLTADLPRIRTSRQDFEDFMVSRLNAAGDREMRKAPRAEYRPFTGRLIISPSGGLLVERPDIGLRPYNRVEDSARTAWMIIDPDGVPLATLMLSTRFVPWHFNGCEVTGVAYAGDMTPYVIQYEVAVGQDQHSKHATQNCGAGGF